MAGPDKHSKTEKPTAKRVREAKREGQIPRSQEIVAWASMLATTFLVQWSIELGVTRFRDLAAETSTVIARAEEALALRLLGEWMLAGLITLAPLLLGLMVLGVATNLAQVGFVPSGKLLKPKWSRVNPLAGFKRLLGTTTLWETVKMSSKMAILALIAVRSVTGLTPSLVDAGRISIDAIVGRVAGTALRMVRDVAIAGLVLAAVDYGFQRKRVMSQLRMTKDELKREHRETDGDPLQRQFIRSKQLAISRNRMMAAITDADVVLVNPTHVAVALKYDALLGPPRVVAKGAGIIADKIRERAAEHGVPMIADIPLTRTIFRACEIGDAIPTDLYDAVARVLAFIFALKRRGRPIEGIHELPAAQRIAV